jgi:hypothetical protein
MKNAAELFVGIVLLLILMVFIPFEDFSEYDGDEE